MRYRKSAITSALCLVLILCAPSASDVEEAGHGRLDLELYFCHFELEEKVKEMNASFSVIYSFRIGEDGQPYEIEQIRDRFVGKETVASCLTEWRFVGLDQESRFVVSANWKHGIGWVAMTIIGKGFRQKLGRHGDLDPYASFPESAAPVLDQY